MKRIILAAFLLANSKPLTFWKAIGSGNPPHISSMAMTGPQKGYIAQGQGQLYRVYSIDWTANTPVTSAAKIIDVGTNTNLGTYYPRIQSDSGFNIVAAVKTIIRFSALPSGGNDFEEYSVPKTGEYAYPFWVAQTNYMFVSARSYTNPIEEKVYRLHSDRITDVETFNTGTNSRAYGVLYGTNFLLVSMEGTSQRYLYDYTTGYESGSNTHVQTHTKKGAHTQHEIGFFSPEDGKDVYVVALEGTKKIFTVKNDGTDLLDRDLATVLNSQITFPQWIKDTDLCVVPSWGENFAIFNFMDTSNPAPVGYSIDSVGKYTYSVGVWKDYKVISLSTINNDKTYMYKTLAETPCADLCATCDGFYRKKCLTCVAHSTRSGDTCSCDFGYYSNNISPTRKECLACSNLCGTCSGSSTTQCLTC